jgi:hypothetical protein
LALNDLNDILHEDFSFIETLPFEELSEFREFLFPDLDLEEPLMDFSEGTFSLYFQNQLSLNKL